MTDYTFPLYQFPLTTEPMGFPPEDNGRGPTIAEALKEDEDD